MCVCLCMCVFDSLVEFIDILSCMYKYITEVLTYVCIHSHVYVVPYKL